MTHARRLVVGLTGGIGSGKSAVARALVACGADLIDTDRLARELTEPGGAAIGSLREVFGERAIGADGALDRAWMRELAFGDDTVRRRLESVLHPMIGERVAAGLAASTATLVVCDVPLLVESGRWRQQVDRVWVVDCDESTQVERVMARSGWSAQQVQAVIRRQASREQRRAAADAVVVNEGIDLDDLARLAASLARRWLGPPHGAAIALAAE